MQVQDGNLSLLAIVSRIYNFRDKLKKNMKNILRKKAMKSSQFVDVLFNKSLTQHLRMEPLQNTLSTILRTSNRTSQWYETSQVLLRAYETVTHPDNVI